MSKNRSWSEAERTLILELYWQLSHEEMDKLKDEHPKIIALAEMLGAGDKATSIYLRLLNFASLDPNAAAALPHVGKKDKELWEVKGVHAIEYIFLEEVLDYETDMYLFDENVDWVIRIIDEFSDDKRVMIFYH